MRTLLARYDLNWKMGATIMTKDKLVKIMVVFELLLVALLIWVAFL